MNNERYEQIIDEVYGQFRKYKMENFYDTRWDVIMEMNVSDKNKPYFATGRILTKEEFINKCKTDQEFSERWGLKIEERELSLEERYKIMQSNTFTATLGKPTMYNNEYYNSKNIPTKLITITYNDKTIESYEINGKLCYCGNPVDTSNPDCVTFNLCKEHQMDV